MSLERRAGAPRLIEWTGERAVPWTSDVQVIYEHFHRYLWAAALVRGRRVLDLGSGEGFGSSILADAAEAVVGIDIDAATVEHSRLNYGAANVRFERADATDLSDFEDGSFGAVVAFEVIEHVDEQPRVMEEIARVLADDGLLVISTPDRAMYDAMMPEPNPFHVHELAAEEFSKLLGGRFADVALWGQRTIAGSYVSAPPGSASGPTAPTPDFFIERRGDEWATAGAPAPIYWLAVASNAGLPPIAPSSTLGDCGLELMRVKERARDTLARQFETSRLELDDARRTAAELAEENERARAIEQGRFERDRERYAEIIATDRADRAVEGRAATARVKQVELEVASREERIAALHAEVLALRRTADRVQQSVTWQAFQRARGRLYRAVGGESSLLARSLAATLRLLGRLVISRPQPTPAGPAADSEPAAAPEPVEEIVFPEFEHPRASLLIPVHAHAELTRACLITIRENTSAASYEVVLVDDTADEATKELLGRVRGAQVIVNDENLGFLRSMNRAAAAARGEWVILFNNDTEVREGWLQAMFACADSAPDVGVVTPKFMYPDGTLNEAGGIVWRDGTAMNYGRGDAPDRFQYEYRRETDYGSAAALMVRSDLWNDIGGFDERYVPIYYEDTDVCFQARERGYRVLYEPEAVVVHIEGATSGTDPSSGAKRHQERNRERFVARWKTRLEEEHRLPAPTNVRLAANRDRGHHVLVIDHRVPMSDRDSGSLRMFGIISTLLDLGARVTFMPENLASLQPYSRALQRMGVEVLYGPIDTLAELQTLAASVETIFLCRPHTTSRFLDIMREFAPAARVAYDTVDLHWVREARRGLSLASPDVQVSHDEPLDPERIVPKAKALRELELALIRACDVTLVVTEGERRQVELDVPGASVVVVPNIHDPHPPARPPDERRGILFVGGFEHIPNGDAAVRLVRDVMPGVWAELGNVPVTIAGGSPPAEVQALASPLVEVAGWVEDLQPLLDRSRLLLAPLRFGAGLKGKVTQCLAVGLPVVTTSIGAEGIHELAAGAGSDEGCLLVADSVPGLVAETVRLYTDDELWWRLSRAGQALIAATCSSAVVSARLRSLLDGSFAAPGDGEAPPPARQAGQPSGRAGAHNEPQLARRGAP